MLNTRKSTISEIGSRERIPASRTHRRKRNYECICTLKEKSTQGLRTKEMNY